MRVFLITGASSGIGAAVARAVAAPDTSLVLHARKNRSGAERVAQAAGAAHRHSTAIFHLVAARQFIQTHVTSPCLALHTSDRQLKGPRAGPRLIGRLTQAQPKEACYGRASESGH